MNKGSSQNQTMLNLLKSVTLNQNNMKKQSSQVPPQITNLAQVMFQTNSNNGVTTNQQSMP